MRCLCGESFSFVSLFFCCAQKCVIIQLFHFDENSTYFFVFKSFDSALLGSHFNNFLSTFKPLRLRTISTSSGNVVG